MLALRRVHPQRELRPVARLLVATCLSAASLADVLLAALSVALLLLQSASVLYVSAEIRRPGLTPPSSPSPSL